MPLVRILQKLFLDLLPNSLLYILPTIALLPNTLQAQGPLEIKIFPKHTILPLEGNCQITLLLPPLRERLEVQLHSTGGIHAQWEQTKNQKILIPANPKPQPIPVHIRSLSPTSGTIQLEYQSLNPQKAAKKEKPNPKQTLLNSHCHYSQVHLATLPKKELQKLAHDTKPPTLQNLPLIEPLQKSPHKEPPP